MARVVIAVLIPSIQDCVDAFYLVLGEVPAKDRADVIVEGFEVHSGGSGTYCRSRLASTAAT